MQIITFAILVASALASSSEMSFETYVEKFSFGWKEGSPEWKQHKEIFAREVERVERHNREGHKWQEGINKFSALTEEEKKAYRGFSKNVKKDYLPKTRQPAPVFYKSVSELPKSVDWRTKGCATAVKDQGSCGSCWAFASTAVIESYVSLNTGLLFDLSVNQLAFCAPNPNSCGGTGGCQGATAELAFDYIANSGFWQDFQQGYSSAAYSGTTQKCATPAGKAVASISGYTVLPSNNYTAVMNALATVGPLAIGVDASWGSYKGGVYAPRKPPSSLDIDHEVVLYGYGEEEDGTKFWLVRNSWAPTWGEQGYIRLLRQDNDDENCAIDNTPQDGLACAGDTTPIKVCGTSGILYDVAYPLGAALK